MQEYNGCVADGGIVCADFFSGPIFVTMFAVDAVALTVFVRRLRVRRAEKSE